MTREALNTYMKDRRARLRAQGVCVDCQKNKAHVDEKGKCHVCCDVCLAARRARWRNGAKPPLIKLIEKVTAAP
jgi:hypothetical protein